MAYDFEIRRVFDCLALHKHEANFEIASLVPRADPAALGRSIAFGFAGIGVRETLSCNLRHSRIFPGPVMRENSDWAAMLRLAFDVIQASKRKLPYVRYQLTDGERVCQQPVLPSKPRGVPRVSDRRG